MKDQSVYDLWVVKQMVRDCPSQCGTAIIERINKVLIEENGAEAVLYHPIPSMDVLEHQRPASMGTPDEAICGRDFLYDFHLNRGGDNP